MITLEKPKTTKSVKETVSPQRETSVWDNAVIYQIYPRTFNDANADGNGDINGIRQRLDYLQSLGVDVVWISPMYQSPMEDGGYDVSDHRAIDPVFGTMNDFEQLAEDLHERGMGMMLDIVPNHTSDQHYWFQASRDPKHPEHEKYKNYFVWRDVNPTRKDNRPNNWQSVFSIPNLKKYLPKYKKGEIDHIPAKSAWTWDDKREQYYLHSFLPQQPDLNWGNPQVVEEVKETMRFWLRKGVDGFRVDAVNYIAKDPKLADEEPNPEYQEGTDNPYDSLQRKNSAGFKGNLDKRLKQIISVLKEEEFEGRNLRVVFEAYMPEDDLERIDRLDPKYASSFNFTVMDQIRQKLKAFVISKTIEEYEYRVPQNGLANEVLGNHDKSRIASALGSQSASRALAVVQSLLPGEMYIYQGEELGLKDTPVPEKRKKDKAGDRDAARVTMPWYKEAYGRFSEAPVARWFLPPNKYYKTDNAESEIQDPNSPLHLYAKLIALRSTASIQSGQYATIKNNSEDVLSFSRRTKIEQTVVVANLSSKSEIVRLSGTKQNIGRVVLSSVQDGHRPGDEIDMESIELAPMEAIVIGPNG